MDHVAFLDQTELYFELYNPELSINFCSVNRTMGNVNSKLQIALTGTNSVPSFAILDHNGKRVYNQNNDKKIKFDKLSFIKSDL